MSELGNVVYTTKLGLSNWTKEVVIRIEFHFTPDVLMVSHFGPDDPAITTYFVDGVRWRMVDFLGLSPLDCAKKLRLDKWLKKDYGLDILIQALEGKVGIYKIGQS